MKLLKFGGTSVGSSEAIKTVITIIQDNISMGEKIHVIFSAFKNVTNQLIEMGNLASQSKPQYIEILKEIESRHINTAKELISVKNHSEVLSHLITLLNELTDVLHGVYLVKELSPRVLDFIMSFGERFSAYIISEALKNVGINCEYLDSRSKVVTNDQFGSAQVDLKSTFNNIRSYFAGIEKIQIITGFIGATKSHVTTTIGRGGSDFTASIFGAALDAEEIEIWTDVDGVMTADPRKVEKAFSLENLTYEEAMELSHFGAGVIHPSTMQPALDKNIPIRIKNTFHSQKAGTLISASTVSKGRVVKGISSIDDIALINVQGSGMVGVTGIAHRIFGALADKSINIILISQASSEHSVCLAVAPQRAESAKQAIEEELRLELIEKKVSNITLTRDLSIVAIVGTHMRQTPGIAGKLFQALGKNGVNVVAIAQGSSELNISTVIARGDESKALNILHDAFFLSPVQTANIFLIGPGLIGSTLIKQIHQQKEFLINEYSLELNIVGLSDTKKMYINSEGIDTLNWNNILESHGEKANLVKFVEIMKEINLPNSIFVDCTADDEVVNYYLTILNSSISIATPNKKANSSNQKLYGELKHAALRHNVKFLYEANVGAGLPIINTLKDMISSGDEIYQIEGILSGTLSYIFNTFSKEKSFSETILDAKRKGYTEPDPREDLNGLDAARKLLILAREIGRKVELADVKVENLVPPLVQNLKSVKEFFTELKKYDNQFEQLRLKAEKKGCVLRYIAKISDSDAEVRLREVDSSHPFYYLSGSDNVLAFTTKHCQDRPVVVQGPGAGADVTASAVFADIIRIAHYLSW
jgi:aspartokinase/homoserine dehydrogenase 1